MTQRVIVNGITECMYIVHISKVIQKYILCRDKGTYVRFDMIEIQF